MRVLSKLIYVSKNHLSINLLEKLKNSYSKNIEIIFQDSIENEFENIKRLSKTKSEIINNLDFTPRIFNRITLKDNTTYIVQGNANYLYEINKNILSCKKFKNIKIVNCISINMWDDYISNKKLLPILQKSRLIS